MYTGIYIISYHGEHVIHQRILSYVRIYCFTPATPSGSFYFVFVEFHGGSAKAAIMTFAVDRFFSCFLFSFVCSLISPLCRYLLPLCVFVWKTAVVFFVFCQCNRYLFLSRAYGVSLAIATCPLLHILENTCRLFIFVLFLFFLSFVPFFLFGWLVLLCCCTRYDSISLALP